MQNEIIVNASPGETRVATLEKGSFVELHIERAGERGIVGNVVKGRVSRVLPGMQAAFVDIGLDKAAFLYVGDYHPDEPDASGNGDARGRGRGRRNGRNGRQPPRIDTLLSEGQEVIVQVAKEPIGTKGARITSHLSIAGRHLVLTPWGRRVGVSRRIDNDRERRRLRDVVEKIRPKDLGFIIRTAGDGVRDSDLEADVKYLSETWNDLQQQKTSVRAPATLYHEPALPMRVIRDVVRADTNRIVVDDPALHAEMQTFVQRFMVDPPNIELYAGDEPIFDHFGLEAQIDQNLGRKVWLKSGGYLIIDQSEALTAIDVNTGRYVGKRDLEETVLKTNLEAVREAVHQLRFRNIGGLIILDLIDMEPAGNRDKVYRALQEVLRGDNTRTNVLKISELGLVEMTRKRTRENLVQTIGEPCAYCDGKGYVLSAESVAFRVLREIQKDLPHLRGRKIAVTVSRRVGELLLGRDREALQSLEAKIGREIEIVAKPNLHHEQFEVRTTEPGPSVPFTPSWLTDGAPDAAGDSDEDETDEQDADEDTLEASSDFPAGIDAEATQAASGASEAAAADPAPEPIPETGPGLDPEPFSGLEDHADEPAPAGEAAAAESSPFATPPERFSDLEDEADEAQAGSDAQTIDVEEESEILPDSHKTEGL
jgi:ribonuclease G